MTWVKTHVWLAFGLSSFGRGGGAQNCRVAQNRDAKKYGMADEDETVGRRRRSKIEMYAHLIWATKAHCPNMTPEMERAAHRCVVAEAEAMRCEVLAVGGMPDHVHLVVRLPGDVGVSTLAKKVKGTSSYLLNTLREPFSDRFDWQKGFAAFSLDKNNLRHAIYYVQNQREHHQSNDLWPLWEETDEPSPHEMPSTQPAKASSPSSSEGR